MNTLTVILLAIAAVIFVGWLAFNVGLIAGESVGFSNGYKAGQKAKNVNEGCKQSAKM